ncbi:hypothetical protein D9Q98_002220 [Chlorella vulgaris]|uniref:Uncharacterized protein n=1 Tax=Chlorella vulgaris TaxID=3077 RepID=A0A9D4TW06_CHLVU|nr:hypothetical protein D9Q98_002220 [Chlorella vulgaris]
MLSSVSPRTHLHSASRVGQGHRRQCRRVTAFATPLAEEGPGSGRRHYPDPEHQQYDVRRPDTEHHDLMSTEDCYRLFPAVIHSSTPLRIDDHEPAGISTQRIGDAGPSTGLRRRPAPTDSSTSAQQLPYPDTRPTDLRREVLARHAPELLLAQQQLLQQRRPEA